MILTKFDAETWNSLLSLLPRVVGITLLLYVVGTVIYRLTVHPLAKYPGPFLAKITNLHNLYHVWKQDRHFHVLKSHQKYGPVYRLGPNHLSFNSSTALQDIYGFKANVQKAKFYLAFSPGKLNTHNTIDKALHARKRRVMSHAFSEQALKSMEEDFLVNIRAWCAALKAKGVKGALNMCDWSTYLTFDVMGELSFGKSFNLIEGENRHLPALMEEAADYGNFNANALPWFFLGISKLLLPKLEASRTALLNFVIPFIDRRMKMEDAKKDFFHHLIDAKDPNTGEGFSLPELWGETMVLMVGGSDTTAIALAGTFFYFAHYPDVLAGVTKEVRDVFHGQTVEDVTVGPKLNTCVYLRACIEESLRMAPPAPAGFPREVCKGGTTIDGRVIPAGINVSVPCYSIHHNPEYFPKPFTYRPERWIVNDGEEGKALGVSKAEMQKAQKAFCAFSLGPRGCLGKNMAYMEMMLVMARVLFLFDIKSAGALGEGTPGPNEWDRKDVWQMRESFTARNDGPLIKFVERDS